MNDQLNEIHHDLEIVNIVATIDFDREFDLTKLSCDLNASYEPERYPSMVFKLKDGGSILLPTSGKAVLTGAKSADHLSNGLNEFLFDLENLGISIQLKDSDLLIRNIVVTGRISNNKLNLPSLAIDLGLENTEFEPEQFPGLIYRLDDIVALLYANGKFVITGSSNVESINSVYEELKKIK